jgi:hypothetical protein
MEIVYIQVGLHISCLVLHVVVTEHGNSVNFHFSCKLFKVFSRFYGCVTNNKGVWIG